MNIVRFIFGLPMAALITVGLFAFMANTIKQPIKTTAPPTTEFPDIVYKKKPPPTEIKKPPTKVPPEPEQKLLKFDPLEGPGGERFEINPGPIELEKGPLKFGGGAFQPTVRIAPQYPGNCQSRNAEGSVLVQFDVTPEGDVINVQIIESADSCFNRTVVRAVSRWKYTPGQGADGRAVARRGVVEKFVFELQE